MINKFEGSNHYLSNFHESPIEYNGMVFRSAEAAFQSQKVLDRDVMSKFEALNPSQAKARGRKVKLRKDWEEVKDQIMYEICLEKFSHDPLKSKLLSTGDQELIEGNWWGDTYWGVSKGKGLNKLGKILMRIRSELK